MKEYLTKKEALEREYDEKYRSFDYDAEADELFRLRRIQLERDRTDGVSDILARYAANTGMAGSSAAMAAAQQTASRYDAQIADALTAAEERAYSRWDEARRELEQRIADNHARAIAEAESRLALGDLSGYSELGYDTSAYKAKLDRERRAQEAQIAASLASAALSQSKAEAEKNSSSSGASGSLSGGSSATLGGNGMTAAEYEATRDGLVKQIQAISNYPSKQKKYYLADLTVLYDKLEQLDKAYHSTPRSYSIGEVQEILSMLSENAALGFPMTVSYPEYLALAKYYKLMGGEKILKTMGITYTKG